MNGGLMFRCFDFEVPGDNKRFIAGLVFSVGAITPVPIFWQYERLSHEGVTAFILAVN